MYWAEKIKNVKSSYDFEKSISSSRFWNEFRFFEPRLTSLLSNDNNNNIEPVDH